MKELEAALEFGATASLDIGVASGSVHMMAGIYFSLQRKDPGNDLAATLTGYLRVGGSLSVLGARHDLGRVQPDLHLREEGKAYGRATLTVQVEVAFFSKSVELTVERDFGGQGGDPTFRELFTTAGLGASTRWPSRTQGDQWRQARRSSSRSCRAASRRRGDAAALDLRLAAASRRDRLGAFRDWQHWTQRAA